MLRLVVTGSEQQYRDHLHLHELDPRETRRVTRVEQCYGIAHGTQLVISCGAVQLAAYPQILRVATERGFDVVHARCCGLAS